jgi:peroxiredoxin
MRNCIRYLAVIAVAFLSVSCVQAKDEAGPVASDFSLLDLNQSPVALSSYIGKQPLLLIFWTTWCPFCQEELSLLNRQYGQLEKDGVAVLAIDVQEPLRRVKRYANLWVFPVLLDEDAKAAEAYSVYGVPTYILINEEGKIVLRGNSFPWGYKAALAK